MGVATRPSRMIPRIGEMKILLLFLVVGLSIDYITTHLTRGGSRIIDPSDC